MIYRVLVKSKVGPHGRMRGPVYGPVLRKKSIQRYAIFFFADHSFLQRTCAFYLFIRQPMGRKSALRREIPWILRGFQGRLSC